MPELNRRGVIAAGLGVAGVATLVVAAGPAQARSAVSRALPAAAAPDHLKRSMFTPALGDTFRAKSATASYTLRLDAIDDVPHLATGFAETCFSLSFSALEGANPPDDVFELSNATTGRHTLFISRVGPRSDARQLQAIVNQSVLVL